MFKNLPLVVEDGLVIQEWLVVGRAQDNYPLKQ